jgi:hypothetical protein
MPELALPDRGQVSRVGRVIGVLANATQRSGLRGCLKDCRPSVSG